jgi:hypothetical protein
MHKKPYTTPRLTVHGDVEKITLQNGLDNADTPAGANDSAFPEAPVGSP